jgi:peptidoglycan-associated lipoprotein
MTQKEISVLSLGFCFLAFTTACTKKTTAAAPPPAPTKAAEPSPQKPVISMFAASPSSIQRGQSATLKWSVEHATNIIIDPGLGSVLPNGDRRIFPSNRTTYTLTAKGPGGTTTLSASVNVAVPSPVAQAVTTSKMSLSDLLKTMNDAFFDYDKASLRPDAMHNLNQDADTLKAAFKEFSNVNFQIEGYCDERGSEEYNLALGDRRATQAKEYLVQFGVPATQLHTISYGKERQQCSEHDEACWQKNRRAHLSVSN